jgi:hypothetical protein
MWYSNISMCQFNSETLKLLLLTSADERDETRQINDQTHSSRDERDEFQFKSSRLVTSETEKGKTRLVYD